MANIKSSEKKNRQRIRHQDRNMARKSAMRTAMKKVRVAVAAKNKKAAEEALKVARPLIDRAAVKGVVKKRAAARTVSRLQVAINALG